MLAVRLLPIAFALALCGCGSIGAIGLPPMGKHDSTPPIETGGLPPMTEDTTTTSEPPPGAATTAEAVPQQPADQSQGGLPAPTAPANPGALGRTDLLGGWTVASAGDSCQLFMTLTTWTGGYRASTRGCANDLLKSVSAWNLQGSSVILAGTGGAPIAHLQPSGANHFSGQTDGAPVAPITFYR